MNLVESRVIEDLERLSQNEGNDAVENCLRLLEPCKVGFLHAFYINYAIMW